MTVVFCVLSELEQWKKDQQTLNEESQCRETELRGQLTEVRLHTSSSTWGRTKGFVFIL